MYHEINQILHEINQNLISLVDFASNFYISSIGERYDFVINADQPIGAYWIQLRSLGECGIPRAQQLAILRYARGPYQPLTTPPTYDFGLPQGVVRIFLLLKNYY